MTAPSESRRAARRWPLFACLAIGIGLVLAPVVFQMFGRAPKGGDMIADFEPYMTTERIGRFRGDLAEIGAAQAESEPLLAGMSPEDRRRFASVDTFNDQWPAIDDDMGSMLTTMEQNIENYRGVAALPPFVLFPWFFVIPGLLIAGLAGAAALFADHERRPARRRRIALGVMGIGLIAAPAVFQMFTRAPGGSEMIDEFKPFMTTRKVTEVQGYFLTIGAAEGELRQRIVPDVTASSGPDALPAVRALNRDWPEIANGMAPMVGTMADNLDNFGAVVSLPAFWLFPWFFVIPGVAVGVLAALSGHIPKERAAVPDATDPATTGSTATGSRRWREVARVVSAAVVVVSVVALAVMAIAASAPDSIADAITRSPAAGSAAPATTQPFADVVRFAPVVSSTPVRSPGVVTPTTSPPPDAPVAGPVPDAPPPPAVPAPAPAPPAAPACALGLPPPPPGGGVASLTPLVPFFGPFSPEAFTMMPAFEPAFPLLAPMLLVGEDVLAEADPLLSALAPPAQQFEQTLFDLLAPFYAPYRQPFLEAEATVATAMAPLVESMATAPGTECIVALEGVLTSLAGPVGGDS